MDNIQADPPQDKDDVDEITEELAKTHIPDDYPEDNSVFVYKETIPDVYPCLPPSKYRVGWGREDYDETMPKAMQIIDDFEAQADLAMPDMQDALATKFSYYADYFAACGPAAKKVHLNDRRILEVEHTFHRELPNDERPRLTQFMDTVNKSKARCVLLLNLCGDRCPYAGSRKWFLINDVDEKKNFQDEIERIISDRSLDYEVFQIIQLCTKKTRGFSSVSTNQKVSGDKEKRSQPTLWYYQRDTQPPK